MRLSTGNPVCYEDFITIKNCANPVVPKSGLYIDMLGGISLKGVANITGAPTQSAQDLVHDSLMLVLSEYELKLQSKLMDLGYSMPSLPRQFEDFGQFDTCNTSVASAYERGLMIKRYENVQQFSSLYIKDLTLKTKHTGPTIVYFKDRRGVLLHSQEVELIGGQATRHDVDKAFATEVLYITLQPNIEVYNTELYCLATNQSCCNTSVNSPYGYWVMGYDDETKKTSCNGYGFSVTLGLVCDVRRAMCFILPYARHAVLYSLGVKILESIIANDRVNPFALASKEWATETIPNWHGLAYSYWETALKNLKNGLKDLDSYCFQCYDEDKPKIYSTV